MAGDRVGSRAEKRRNEANPAILAERLGRNPQAEKRRNEANGNMGRV
jgi:hypothetical protein